MNDSANRYYVKNAIDGTFQDITTQFNGVAILKVDNMMSLGKAVNVYTAQWVNSQEEDFLITTLDENENPVIIRENTDIEVTFVVRQKYATGSTAIDVQNVHDTFVAYMTGSDIWLKSSYMGNKFVHCVCLKEYKPTTIKLQRGSAASYAMGTITLHTLEAPQSST
jgi:hypothetical protein